MSEVTTAALGRQTGLLKELSVLANNIANAGTAGFKREASVFTEYVRAGEGSQSISQASFRGHYAVLEAGAFVKTDGTYDLAIMDDGFFAVDTPDGIRLTRAGQFLRNEEGQLSTMDGQAVLDEGGGSIDIPGDAGSVTVATDGTISIDGLPQARLGVFSAPAASLVREGGNLWRPSEGYTFIEDPVVRQGYIEQSNVNPIIELARLVEAQRLFEAGQSILDTDHERQSDMIRRLGDA